MPRDGSGVYSKPAGTTASPNTTIESTKYNAFADDLVSDANGARPITAGGTGATTAVGAADAISTKSTAIPSATTTDLSTATGRFAHITGATTITGFGTVAAGVIRELVFDGALTLTHNATSLILPGGANITTGAGDTAIFVSEGSGNWRCLNYSSEASGTFTPTLTCGTSGTITLASSAIYYVKIGRLVHINGILDVSAVSSPSGSITMGTLPFASLSYASFSLWMSGQNTSSSLIWQAFSTVSATTIDIGYYSDTGATGTNPAGSIDSDTVMVISGSYLT